MHASERRGRRLFLVNSLGASLAVLLGACGGGSEDGDSVAREDPAARPQALDAAGKGSDRKPKRRARSFARKGVTAIAVANDGSAVGVAYADGRVRLLDGGGARDKRLLKGRGGAAVAGLVFSADGRYLVTVGRDSVAEFWSVESGERRLSLHGHEHALRTVAASTEGSVIATAGDETRVMVWDGNTGKLKRILGGHTDFVNALALSPDGSLLASGDADARILVWQLATGRLLHTLRGHADELNAVAFSADGTTLVSAGEDGKVIVWAMDSGRQLQALAGHHAPVRSLALSQDGTMLAAGGVDGRVVVWDMSTGTVAREISASAAALNVVKFDRNKKNQVFVGDEQDGVMSLKLAPG